MAQKTGALIFDETADRYDIRFDIADYYGGLHCYESFFLILTTTESPVLPNLHKRKTLQSQKDYNAS